MAREGVAEEDEVEDVEIDDPVGLTLFSTILIWESKIGVDIAAETFGSTPSDSLLSSNFIDFGGSTSSPPLFHESFLLAFRIWLTFTLGQLELRVGGVRVADFGTDRTLRMKLGSD